MAEVTFPVTGFAGAQFSEEEVRHPQAFGRAYMPSTPNAAGFVKMLQSNGFEYNPIHNPTGVAASDYEYLRGLYNFGGSVPQEMILIRRKSDQRLWMPNYDNVINFDQWLSLSVELINGWGFKPGDEQ